MMLSVVLLSQTWSKLQQIFDLYTDFCSLTLVPSRANPEASDHLLRLVDPRLALVSLKHALVSVMLYGFGAAAAVVYPPGTELKWFIAHLFDLGSSLSSVRPKARV